jgi:hypothetical protein
VVLEQRESDRLYRDHGLGVLDELAELGVALVADGLVYRDGFPGILLNLQRAALPEPSIRQRYRFVLCD